MVVRFIPRLPRQQITAQYTPARVRRWLRETAEEFKKEMQEYPPKLPWRGKVPTKGPRRGGRRTGRYKRGWEVTVLPDRFRVSNSVPYAVYVGGPRRSRGQGQARFMRDRGWKSQTDVGRIVVQRNLRRLRRLVLPYAKIN